MATKNNRRQANDPAPGTPSRGPMIVLIAGSIAIAALVGWALTRSVEPAPPNVAVAPAPMPPTATSAATTTVIPGTPTATTPATATAATATGERGAVKRMQPQELKTLVDRGSVTIVDVRDSASYSTGHIPGAVHIPFARIEGESRYLPKDKPIVAYCT